MKLVQGMYKNVRSHVRVGEGLSEEFEVKVSVHQESVFSPLLFIIVLEARGKFSADYPVFIADSMEECVRRLLT